MKESSLYNDIYKMIMQIPRGEIASYSQVAKAVGMPRGAQVVGWALGAVSQEKLPDLPWQRVVNQKRQLTIKNPKVGPSEQRELLEREGRSLEYHDESGLWQVTGDDWWQSPEPQARPPR